MEQYLFGVDIGGTTVKLGLFQTDGTLCDKWEIHSRTENKGKCILSDVADSVAEKIKNRNLDKTQVLGIGVGVPGPVIHDTTVLECVNLGWGVTHVADELKALLGFKVKVGNDANVAALGEMWQGGGKGYKNMVMVTLGTGVGGGIILDEKILTGSNGSAGEIGHITVNFEENAGCNCGKVGCLEQYASASGIVRLGKKLLNESMEPTKLRNYTNISAKAIFDCAKEGDALAKSLVDELGKYLGIALSHVASVVDPQAFVIGGGVSKAGSILIDVTKKYYKPNVMKSLKDKDFKLAKLGNDAGIYGCARMVLDQD